MPSFEFLLALGAIVGALCGISWWIGARTVRRERSSSMLPASQPPVSATGDLAAMSESLHRSISQIQRQMHDLDRRRMGADRELAQQVRTLHGATTTLSHALRAPKARGRWGELHLRRAVEAAGMLDHCDFHEQPTYRGRDSELLRPDLVVHLAGGRDIVVDAKVPMDAYLESIDAANEHDRDALEQQHAGKLRAHIRALSSRKYGTNIPRAVSLVVLFLPTEDLLRVSLERDPSLLEDAARHDIALATPSTLIALLRGVAYGWQEAALAEHAQHICELGATLHDRIAVVTDHLAKLGRSLDASVRSFDETVGSVQSRLIPVARELSSAGVSTGREVSEVAQLHRTTRAVSAS